MDKKLIAVLVLVLGVCAFSLADAQLQRRATIEEIAVSPEIGEMGPGEFLGTVSFGGVRPYVINLLWVRAADAFSRKDWFDALAVSELICRLQPNLPEVWNMNSWNLAYNISVSRKQQGRMEEAWEWVRKGIEFQEKGLVKNPDSLSMRIWLSHMYLDKGGSDDYYDEFEKIWGDPLERAIEASRDAARLDKIGYSTHHRLGVYLQAKLERMGAESKNPLALQEAEPLAREAIASLLTAKRRVPELKDFVEFSHRIGLRISKLERFLEKAKDDASSESKKDRGNR